MSSISSRAETIAVEAADLSDKGVLVRFSEGTIVLFHAQFLYDVRDQDANVPLSDESNDDR